MARFFIDRPIMAWVMALVIALAGARSMVHLPVERYPMIAPPTVNIEADYPGASAETLESSVVQVIEQQMSGIDHLRYMSSASTASTATVTLTFAAGTDPDIAQVQVQDKLQGAVSRLPAKVQQLGLSVTKSSSARFLLMALVSEDGRYDRSQIGDFISSTLRDPLSRLDGVGSVEEWGEPYAMHLWLDPGKLQSYGLMPSDVSKAVEEQNVDIAAGELGDLPAVSGQRIDATITARSRLSTPEQFRQIVLKSGIDGSRVRLGDVARVEKAREGYAIDLRYNGKPTAAVGLYLASGANALKAAREAHAFMDKRSASFPKGLKVVYPMDMSPFIVASVEEVAITLGVAIVLVVLIIYVFLQNLRATLIPAVAVPVVVAGTFVVLDIFGYSINTLTLFGLVLAIGLLVDDAIVVVENVERVMRAEGLSPIEATRRSMDEIGGALIGIGAVLSAVLVPMAFFDGSTGVIYRQFSVTVVSAMVLSVIVALTLTPALCATVLKAGHVEAPHRCFIAFDRHVDGVMQRCRRGIHVLLRRRRVATAVYAVAVLLAIGLLATLPSSFLPVEDQGLIQISATLPTGATQERIQRVMRQVQDYLLKQPEVASVLAVAGYSFGGAGQNGGMFFVRLKDWRDRPGAMNSAQAIIARATRAVADITDATINIVQPSSMPGLGRRSGFDMQLLDLGSVGHAGLVEARERLLALAAKDPLLSQVRYDGLRESPRLVVDIDDQRAGAMGIAPGDVNATLESAMGGVYINDFIDRGRIKRVVMQADAPFRMTPDNIGQWYVRNEKGGMVPFSAFSRSRWSYGPTELDRYEGSATYEIVGSPAQGVSSGTAMTEMAKLVSRLPPGVGYEWTGESYQQRQSDHQAPWLYAASIGFVFLCLAALYESWVIPFAVLLVVPFGLLGAALATAWRGLSMDVYFQVGLLTTIGLSAKNAILIVEFASLREGMGDTTIDAVLQAVAMRFRPIVMTSLAFVLGVAPLAFGTGAGAAARHSIGTGVVGGTLMETAFGIFYGAFFYVVMRRFGHTRHTKQGLVGVPS
nr:efflux RND transporter permease subunit [Luteibacter sp.]